MAIRNPGKLFFSLAALLAIAPITATTTPARDGATQVGAADGGQSISREALTRQLAEETGIDAAEIAAILRHATFRPQIIARMNRQWEAQPYSKYRPLFIKPAMQREGRAYLKQHHEIFSRIEQKYEVDPPVIAAILGIETRFGRSHGSRPILDSLYTLSTGYPRRADFFRRQLGAIIQISREEQIDLTQLKGSYAGAFGAIQFIPTSFRQYAVDENGDGVRDVIHTPADIIGSVANYFHQHGWQHRRPVAFWLPEQTTLTPDWQRHVESDNISQWTTLGELRRAMPDAFAQLPALWRDDDRVSLIRMQTDSGMRVALIHHNFRVIMRYNPAFNYAMAVTEIAAMLENSTTSQQFAVQ